jgi:hypothetical protein
VLRPPVCLTCGCRHAAPCWRPELRRVAVARLDTLFWVQELRLALALLEGVAATATDSGI